MDSAASQLWEPQFRAPELQGGLFLVAFDIRKTGRGRKPDSGNAEYKQRVIRVDEELLQRRLRRNGNAP